MQCHSYFPVYHTRYDLNVDANGGARPLYNSNGAYRSGHYSSYTPSSPIQQGSLEVLRQTILMHEVTFRSQVQELHRLYRRQKELMSDIRSQQLYINNSHLDSQSSNTYSAKFSPGCGHSAQNNLPLASSPCWLSPTSADAIKEKRIPVGPIVSVNAVASNISHCPESKAKKIGGKFLDLELPAEEYIDSEEGESLENAAFSETLVATSLSANQLSLVVLTIQPKAASSSPLTDLNEPPTVSTVEKRDTAPDQVGRNFNEGNTRSDDASNTPKIPPLQVEEANSEVCTGSSPRKSLSNFLRNSSVVQALPCLINQSSSKKAGKICSKREAAIDDKLDTSTRCSPNSGIVWSEGIVGIDLNSLVTEDPEIMPSVDIKTFGEFDGEEKDLMVSECGISSVDSMEGEVMRESKKCRLFDINLPCDPSIEEEPLIKDDTVEHNYNNSGQINLNFCMKDDGLPSKPSSLESIVLEIDLEAPLSPEVEECPPPRGGSEENHPEDGGDPFEELAKVAANAIVSISSLSKSQAREEGTEFQKREASDCSDQTLEWFAGLICSAHNDIENLGPFEATSLRDTHELDDFEAMTLELPEMKAEEYLCTSTIEVGNVSCSTQLAGQTRKGRTRRSKRKDFQREVLPSLSSLSRYEVTEDIQMIEGLMEAAGTPWQLGRTRRACRLGRRPRAVKQIIPVYDTSGFNEGGAAVNWGKVNRRPRKRRSPASPTTVLTKWLEFAS